MAIDPSAQIHESACVEPPCEIGQRTRIWRFCHVMAGAVVGDDVMLGQSVFVAGSVKIGGGCRVQNHVSLYEGVELEQDVFLGPSCVFTNVKHPRAHVSRKEGFARTLVQRGATIGANATLAPGVTIGRFAFVGAGSVVTRDVADFALVFGTPARQRGWVGERGVPLTREADSSYRCPESGALYREIQGALVRAEAS